jgi:hypothetical protein
MWDNEQIKKEKEIVGKLNAFAHYVRDRNFSTIDQLFPQFKEFVTKNKGRKYEDVEQELLEELNQFSLVHH